VKLSSQLKRLGRRRTELAELDLGDCVTRSFQRSRSRRKLAKATSRQVVYEAERVILV
jgi:hypothetical protein